MATANLNKSEDFVTNTTVASKYIPTLESRINEQVVYWKMKKIPPIRTYSELYVY